MAGDKETSILTPHQKAVLEVIARESYFAARFYFGGGTALAEFYLQHRLSEDLDFFAEVQEVNPVAVLRFLQAQSRALHIEKIETSRVLGLHTFFLHFYDHEVLKVDFSYYPFPKIESGAHFYDLEVESVRDIAVDKVHTVAIKPRARDFIDIYFIVREKGYRLGDLLLQAKAKFDWDISALDLGARFLEGAEMTDYPRMLKAINHHEWKEFFVEEAKKLKKEVFG